MEKMKGVGKVKERINERKKFERSEKMRGIKKKRRRRKMEGRGEEMR